MTEQELRPCPFCGCDTLEIFTDYYSRRTVNCPYCGMWRLLDTWNNRPIEDEPRKRIAELEGKLAELIEAADKMYDVTEYILGGDTVEMFYCREIAKEARDVLKGEWKERKDETD